MHVEQGFIIPTYLRSEQDGLANASMPDLSMGFIDPLRIRKWIISSPRIPELPDVMTIIESVKKLAHSPEFGS